MWWQVGQDERGIETFTPPATYSPSVAITVVATIVRSRLERFDVPRFRSPGFRPVHEIRAGGIDELG